MNPQHHMRAGDDRHGVNICRALVAELEPGPLRADALRTLAKIEHPDSRERGKRAGTPGESRSAAMTPTFEWAAC